MSELKFKEGQLLAYGTNGICIVDVIKPISLTSGMKHEDYYVLRQLKDEDSKIFVPVDNERLTSKMRQLLTSEEIVQLVKRMDDERMEWIKDRRIRIENFKKILAEGVGMDLLRMIACIKDRIAFLESQGKKLPVTDANSLKVAERLVLEEFSFVMGKDKKELDKYFKLVLSDPESAEL